MLLALGAGAAAGHDTAPPEPPAAELDYVPPAPGSYELPMIGRVAEHWLIAQDGSRAPVLGVGDDEVAIVSFIYTSCPDACPLALATLQRLDRELAVRPELVDHVRMTTVSFDPARDDPGRMAEMRAHMAPRGRWDFLTAEDARAIEPVLRDFGQDVRPPRTEEEAKSGQLRHVLKVFLVDGDHAVRNIYSVGFLDARILLNDVATVLEADRAEEGPPPNPSHADPAKW